MSYARALALGGALLALTACGSGGGALGGIFGGSGFQCNPGTQVQLANPTNGQSGVNPNIGSITIVANGNNNTLFNTYRNWSLVLSDNVDPQMQSSQLNLVSDPNGPHPYGSDFYYSASIQSLPSGRTWNVGLQQNSNGYCSAYPLYTFST